MSLIEPDELRRRLTDPNLRIADVRWQLGAPEAGREAYDGGHIPGALFLDLETDLRSEQGPARHALPEPVDLRRRMEELGFSDDQTIVAVDDARGAIAARLWWMLDDLGHADVRVLHGGLEAWRDLDLPWTDETTDVAAAGSLCSLRDRWSRAIEVDDLSEASGRLLDARAPERYRGEVEPIDPAAGHIPGALNLPFAATLDDRGRFLDRDALRAVLGSNGAADTVYCGSGVTACHLALAFRLAGLPAPQLYAGSWSEWSGLGREVATGPAPGS
ncbi:MAG: sulfurtransferase [Acidobacteriota bacterium]